MFERFKRDSDGSSERTTTTAREERAGNGRTAVAERPATTTRHEEPATRRHPEIARTLAALESAGATDVRMSGSGATCFGFAPDATSSSERIVATLFRSGLYAWPARILTAPLG